MFSSLLAGGNSKGLMFCKSLVMKSETCNTLLFASRVRSVELGQAQKNTAQLENYRSLVNEQKSKVQDLANEIDILKKDLRDKDRQITVTLFITYFQNQPVSTSGNMSSEIRNF